MVGTNDAGGNLTKIEKSASILSVPKFQSNGQRLECATKRIESSHVREEYYSGRKWTHTIKNVPLRYDKKIMA